MKKRMFLTTVLMTLVLLLAVTTATFAWYQASTGTRTTDVSNKAQVLTEELEYKVGALTFTVKFGKVEGNPVLTDDSGKVYYYTGAATDANKHEDTSVLYSQKYGSTSVYVEVTAATGENLVDALKALNNAESTWSYTFTIAGDGKVKVWKDEPTEATKDWSAGSVVITVDASSFSLEDAKATAIQSASTAVYFGYEGTDGSVEKTQQGTISAKLTAEN